MDAKERQALEAALRGLSAEQLEQVHDKAKETLRDLEDLNSAFPATQEFLQARGLTNVRQLDKQGMAELRTHLEGILQGLCKAKA
ncbi:MAG TPA: hypothetical protein VL426_06130 [Candidatus Binatia bacterium]|jgi:hypothetical protein|nr:hypothetical protein [Candidatus Binatia bacterium]